MCIDRLCYTIRGILPPDDIVVLISKTSLIYSYHICNKHILYHLLGILEE